jgi:uncharacterized protein YndB with AHSA1/START domain
VVANVMFSCRLTNDNFSAKDTKMSDSPVKSMKKKDLAVSHVFNAPVQLVGRAWSDPALVMRWWGPDHFASPSAEIDFREAGTSLFCMRAPKEMGRQDMYSTWAYKKIVPMKLIEFIQNLADKDGNPLDPVKLGLPVEFPMDIRTGVTFNDLGKGKTEMTVTEYGWTVSPMLGMAETGLNQSLDKMVASIATDVK